MEIIDEEAKIVRLIYSLFIKGKTAGWIANYLTKNNFKTPARKDKWQKSTVDSILTNEKYKGDALLQKTFTVNFLEKKMKKNEGEIPQYYVENSHPAIIDPINGNKSKQSLLDVLNLEEHIVLKVYSHEN